MGKNNNEKKAKQSKPKQPSESSGDGTKTYQNCVRTGKPSDGSF